MLRRTCSLQRVSHVAEHVVGFHRDDFANQLLVLHPTACIEE